jgi:hypothetical protein
MVTDLDTLEHFVGQQAIRGKLTPNTAQSYLSSIGRTFASATEAERANVLRVDLDGLFKRFRDDNSTLGADTLRSYEGRVRAALGTFAEFVKNEGKADILPLTMGTLAIPLRTGVIKIDGLPSDLTPIEANRIAAMIVAMAN